MTGRRLGVLLLFAAVFCMHVLPLVTVGNGADHGRAAVSAAMSASSMVSPPASVGGTEGHPPGTPSAGALIPVEQSADQKAPGHEGATHIWASCLAVFFVVLSVLAATLFRRTGVPSVRAAASSVRRPVWLARPRPPDLFALCLLRI